MQPPPGYQQPPAYRQPHGYQQPPPYYQQQYGYGWQPSQKKGLSSGLIILTVATVLLIITGALFALSEGTSLFSSNTNQPGASIPSKTQEPAAAQEPEPTEVEINAKKLIEAYETDKETAETKYKGKILIITGVVDSIFISGDNPYVLLTSGEPYATGAKCIFTENDASKMFQLEAGKTVKVQGKIGDYAIDIIVNDCIFVQ